MVPYAYGGSGMLARGVAKASVAGTFIWWTTLAAHAQSTRHVDEANHFEVQVPEGWHPIQESLVDALDQQLEEQAANKRSRYVGGYSMSPDGELILPYVLLQVTEGPMNRVTEAALIRQFKAEPWNEEVSETLSDVLKDVDLEPTWDPVERQIIMSIAAEVPGVGPIRGISVARVASHGLVQLNCYAQASEFDAATRAFHEWIDGLQIDADYQWKPGSEGGIDWREVGLMGLIGALAGGLGTLLYQRLRRSET
jgi:hypothetical protein